MNLLFLGDDDRLSTVNQYVNPEYNMFKELKIS
jgi:hypothetical protein